MLNDPEAWKSALLSSTGGGFIGVIGKAASTVQNAVVDTYTQTGIALNLPNPETGQIEEKFISPEFVTTFFSELNDGVDDVIVEETERRMTEEESHNDSDRIKDATYQGLTRDAPFEYTDHNEFVRHLLL